MREHVIVDIETAAIDGADQFIEPVEAPANYKDATKIAEYVANATAKALVAEYRSADLHPAGTGGSPPDDAEQGIADGGVDESGGDVCAIPDFQGQADVGAAVMVESPAPFFMVGALIAFTWLMSLVGELVEQWIARQETQRQDEQQWEQWIAAYQARHGRR